MSKKFKVVLSLTVVLFGFFVINIGLKDDVQEIQKIMSSLNQSMITIAHIELLNNKEAIAFYDGGNSEIPSFGSALFKKNLFGWKLTDSNVGELSHGSKLDWGFSNLAFRFNGYTDLIRGKILDPKIEEVNIKTASENEFKANIIEYGDGQKLWFLVSNGEDLLGSTITGLSSEGKLLEQIIK